MPPAIIAAGIVAGGTIGGALLSSNASKSAADKQSLAAAQALDFQKSIFDWNKQTYETGQNNLAPYLAEGTNAGNTLDQIYGWGGQGGPGQPNAAGGPTSPNALAAFFNTPDYQFALQQGTRALDMSAASKHQLNTGGMVRASQDYGQGLASQQYGNVISRLMSILNVGQNAATTSANVGAGYAGANVGSGQQVGNSYGAYGQAQASGIVGSTNPYVSALNTGPGNTLAAYSQFGGNTAGNPLPINPSSYVNQNPLSWYGNQTSAMGGAIY